MGKDTGLYSYILQKTRGDPLLVTDPDIFNKDYSKLKFSPHVSSGFAIKAASKNGVYTSMYSTQLKNGNFTADIKFSLRTDPNVFTTFIVDGRDLFPGLKAICKFNILKPSSDVVGLQYQHDYAGINVHIMGLTGNPIFNFSGFLRDITTALGTDVSFDTRTGQFTSGITLCYKELASTLTFNNKGSTLSASYCHKVHGNLWKNMNAIQRALASLSIIAFGAEATHNLSNHQNTISFSTQFALSCATTLKVRYNNFGVASAFMRSKVTQNSSVGISSVVYTRAADRTPKFGVSFSTK